MKVLPCPFCGGKAKAEFWVHNNEEKRPAGYHIKAAHADGCYFEGGYFTYYARKKNCIEEWNKRA